MADPITLDFDLSTVEAWDGTKSFSDLPPGAYKARTVTAEPHTGRSSGKPSFAVEVETDVGSTTIYLGLDFSKDPNKKKLRTALVSCGVKPETLSKVKALDPRLFVGPEGKGRECYIIVKEVDGVDGQGRKKLNDKEFLTPDQFAAYTKTNGAAAPKAAKTAAAPAAGADDVASLFT